MFKHLGGDRVQAAKIAVYCNYLRKNDLIVFDFNGKLCTLNVHIIWICEKKMEMFNTFNVQNHENSIENCVY